MQLVLPSIDDTSASSSSADEDDCVDVSTIVFSNHNWSDEPPERPEGHRAVAHEVSTSLPAALLHTTVEVDAGGGGQLSPAMSPVPVALQISGRVSPGAAAHATPSGSGGAADDSLTSLILSAMQLPGSRSLEQEHPPTMPPTLGGPSVSGGAADVEGRADLGTAAVAAMEAELNQRFMEMVQGPEADMPVPPASCLVLETSVGLNVNDLDDLLARLMGGHIDLRQATPRPSHLPDPDSLFTDSDASAPGSEDEGPFVGNERSRRQMPAAGALTAAATSAVIPSAALASLGVLPPPPVPSVLQPAMAEPVPAESSPPATSSPGPPQYFSKFGKPLPPLPDSTAFAGGGPAHRQGPTVVDLRKEVADTSRRVAQAAAAPEAARVAAAARWGSGFSRDNGMPAQAAQPVASIVLPRPSATSSTFCGPMASPSGSSSSSDTWPPQPPHWPSSAVTQHAPAATHNASLPSAPAATTSSSPRHSAGTNGSLVQYGNSISPDEAAKAVPSTNAPVASIPPTVTPVMRAAAPSTEDDDDEAFSRSGPVTTVDAPSSASCVPQVLLCTDGTVVVAAGMCLPLTSAVLRDAPRVPLSSTSGHSAGAEGTSASTGTSTGDRIAHGRTAVVHSRAGADEDADDESFATALREYRHARRQAAAATAATSSSRANALSSHTEASATPVGSRSPNCQPSTSSAPPHLPLVIPSPAISAGGSAAHEALRSPMLSRPQLPSWLPPHHCFTLALSPPGAQPLQTLLAGQLLQWLLRQQAKTSPPPMGGQSPQHGSPTSPAGASFTVVSVRLQGLPEDSPLLPSSTCSSSASSGAPTSPSPPLRLVLLAACVPGAVDPDLYRLGMTRGNDDTAVQDAALTMGAAASRLRTATWGDVVAHQHGSFQGVLPAGYQRLALADSIRTSAGADFFTGAPSTSGSAAGSTVGSSHADAYAASVLSSTSSSSRTGPHSRSTRSSADGAGTTSAMNKPSRATSGMSADVQQSVVCVVSLDGLRRPNLVSAVVSRAAACGLVLQDMCTLYLAEADASRVALTTPHRPHAYCAAVVLLLAGQLSPHQRWAAQLGPANPAVARIAEPTSLHATLAVDNEESRVGEAGRTASEGSSPVCLFTSSYDAAGAQRECVIFFGRSSGLSAGPSGGGVAEGAAAVAHATQWLALEGGTWRDMVGACWVLHHWAWCGFVVRSCVRCVADAAQIEAAVERLASRRQPRISSDSSCVSSSVALSQRGDVVRQLVGRTALFVEVVMEEGSAELRAATDLALSWCDAEGGPAGAAAGLPAVGDGVQQGRSIASGNAAFSAAAMALAALAPQPHVLQDEVDELYRAKVDGAGHPGESAATSRSPHHPQQPHLREQDELVCVALPSRRLLEVLRLLLGVLAGAGGIVGDDATGGTDSAGGAGPPILELVALRLIRHLPADVASRLEVVVAPESLHGRTAADHEHPLAGQPCVLAAFYGPGATERVTATLLQTSPSSTSSLPHQMHTLNVRYSFAPFAKAASATSVMPSVTRSRRDAEFVLLHSFHPLHIALDPSFHDGLRRPSFTSSASPSSNPRIDGKYSATNESGTSSTPVFHSVFAASPPSSAVTPSLMPALYHLLAGPHLVPTLCIVSMRDIGGTSVVSRLLRLLCRDGFVVRRAELLCVPPAVLPLVGRIGVSGGPAGPAEGDASLALWLERSNALSHLRDVLQDSAGLSQASIAISPTLPDALHGIQQLWPHAPTVTTSPHPPAAKQHLVRPTDADGMQQATCLVVLPHAEAVALTDSSRAGGATSISARMALGGSTQLQGRGDSTTELDWLAVSDVLEALHGDGYCLVGLRTLCVEDRRSAAALTEQALLPAKQAAAVAACVASGKSAMMLALALIRANAVTHLQMCLAGGGTGGGTWGRPAGLAGAMFSSQSSAAAEKQLSAWFRSLHDASGFVLSC